MWLSSLLFYCCFLKYYIPPHNVIIASISTSHSLFVQEKYFPQHTHTHTQSIYISNRIGYDKSSTQTEVRTEEQQPTTDSYSSSSPESKNVGNVCRVYHVKNSISADAIEVSQWLVLCNEFHTETTGARANTSIYRAVCQL